jgi:hypothetical protein
MHAPNEKLIETLFTYYTLRFLDGSGATVYTPSAREEYHNDYDARRHLRVRVFGLSRNSGEFHDNPKHAP